jgi:hypothetical protein
MLRAERAARAPPTKRKQAVSAPAPASKKRKADDDDDTDTRKRSRPQLDNANVPAGFYDERDEDEEEDEESQAPIPGFVPAKEQDPSVIAAQDLQKQQTATKQADTIGNITAQDIPSQQSPATIDEAEWAAFQEFTTSIPSKSTSAIDALKANATLEGAPLSAEEAAAQARQAQNDMRSKREEEIQDEKEEAAERLEEEFEVMGELEDRIRKLKEKRETLRRASKASADAERPTLAVKAQPEPVIEESDEDDDESDADEFDAWRFGAS